MLKLLEDFFAKARGRNVVATEFLRLGLSIDENAIIRVGSIEIPPVKIARALGVDRRVVIATAKAIAKDDRLLRIFCHLRPRAFMGNAAKELGFDSIQISADAKRKGVAAEATKILACDNVNIRQIITDDPELFPDPVMTIIIDGKLNAKTIKKLKEMKTAKALAIR